MDERDKSRDCSVDVSVAIRIRPLNSREKAVGETGYAWGHNSSMIWTNTAAVAGSMAQMNDQRCASFSTGTSAGISAASTTYTFDHIFGQASITADVYNILASDLVESCMKGINGTIFAYGQTSSGKTHTMMGDESEPGIILLAVENIFRHISKNQDSEFLLRVSYLEIYNEVIRDLLEPGNINLKIHETINRDIFVGNLSEHVVSSAVQIKEILAIGEGNRHIGETNMNDKSSRSHTIFKMVVESRFRKDNADAVKVSQLNLVDLAGSERVGHTGAEGIRLKEGGHINKSLLTLSTVIGKLSDGGDKRHIPYRDSKLTRILQPSIGGNANTAIICTITPAQLHSDETHSTLRFASRAKTITNKPQVNELVSDETLLKRYKREIDQLKKQLVQLRTVESGQSSTENSMSQSPLPDASDLCIKPSISKKAVLEESLTGSKHGIQEKLLLNEKLDSLRHAILDSTCIGLEDISDRSLKKKARSNRRQTWFPGVSENASALTESEKIETQTWYQNLPEKAEIKIHCSRESNVMECTTVNADTQTHDCSLQLAVEKILDGQQLPSDDHYIQILQPLVACIQSYNLKVSFLTTKETQLQKVVEQLQNKLLQDETVVQQACENYGKQKSINKQLKLDLEDSKEQLTRTTKALEDSESACQSALDMCNIQKQASQCLHNEICDLKMSNSELKAQQEKTNTVLFGISTELQETIEQVHLLQLQEKKYLSTIEQQNNQLRHYCEKEKDQSSLIEQLQVQLQDFLQEKRDFESKTIEALQHSIMEKEAAEALASNFESKLFETISEMDTINIQNMDYIQRIVSEKDTTEMRVSDLEDKLAHTMQEKDELIDQNLKNAENSKLLKESAVARALELETQLKQAFFDRDTAEMRVSDLEDKLAHTMQEKDELIDQNLKNAENSKLLKESAVAHALELETQLKQAFFDRDTAEMRVSDLEDKLAHTMQEKDELIDQNLKNAENSKLLKESAVARALELETQLKQAFFDRDTAEMRVSDLEDKLAHTMQEKDELIDQNLKNAENSKLLKESAVAHALELETQLKQAFFDRDTAEMRVSDLEDKLAHTMQEKDELIDQNLKNAENSKLLKESAVAHALELETQLKQAFFDREVLLAQNATEIQHFEKEKNLANTRVRDLESQLTQISSVVQQLQNEKNAIEERLLDSEMEFKHILEEKSLLIIQSTANVQRFEAEKVAADDLVHELKGQLIQVMDEKETLINQGLDDVQRAISEKEIVECHMMDLETKLAQTLKEMETAATQSAIDIQHLEADKNSAELQEKESYLRAKEVNIYKFMEQLCLLIDDAYTKFKRNCELEQSLEFAKKASTEIQKNITALQKRYEGNNVSKNCHVDWHEEIGQKHRLVNENFERLKRDHQPLCSDTLFILEQEKSTMSELFQLHQEKFKFMDMNGILEKRLDDKLSHCQSISTELDALHYELQSTNSVYEKNRKDLEERIASLEIDLIERDQQICNLDRQYTQKCRDTETLRVLLEDERAEKENEISLFEQDAKQSTCDQTRLQNRANDLTNEIAALRDQIKEGSTKTDAFWSQKVHDLESKLAAAHIEYEQLQSSLQSLSIIMDAAKDVLKNRGFISFEDFESIYSSQTSTGYNVAFEFKKASRKVSELEQTLVERDKQIEDLKIRLRRSLESIDQETMIDRKLEHSVLPNNVSEIEPAALSAFSYLQNNRPIKSGQQSEEENTELILSLTKVAMLEQEVHMLKKKLQTMGMCLADEKGQKRQLELEIMRLENQIQLQKSKPVIQAAHIVADLENFDSLPMNTKSQQPVNQKLSVLSETVCNVNSKVDAHCQPEQNTTGTSTLSHKRTHGLTSDVTQGTRRPRLMNKADASQPVGRQREIGASGRQTRIKDKVLKEGQPGECNQQ
ncbi:hypothetical protein BDEG_23034 [Batrachochytrium dendrobatidis JEL423]|nr:hypothetical protein BDEG_23034 [Batrachochytrium dendrobatidis JEL423]